jgi:hypothetical protein
MGQNVTSSLLRLRLHPEFSDSCKGFSVGLVPQKVSDLTRRMNPIKLREYPCAGLPVVATALPEVMHYRQFCTIAEAMKNSNVGRKPRLRPIRANNECHGAGQWQGKRGNNASRTLAKK